MKRKNLRCCDRNMLRDAEAYEGFSDRSGGKAYDEIVKRSLE
jgi:hypothetical protein